jgi:hypothetical protein
MEVVFPLFKKEIPMSQATVRSQSQAKHRPGKRSQPREEAPMVAPVQEEMPAVEVVEEQPPRVETKVVTPAGSPAEIQWGKVELGPSLPMSVFTSMEVWNPERIGALALYCSDGRWGEAFDEFCHKHLRIPRYDRLAVPGGPGWLVPHDSSADHLYQAAREQLDFLVRAHQLEQIVLITHYGCAFYGERLHQDPDHCLCVQTADTGKAAETLRLWFPEVKVTTYLAMRRGSCFTFHGLNS